MESLLSTGPRAKALNLEFDPCAPPPLLDLRAIGLRFNNGQFEEYKWPKKMKGR